MTDLGPRIRQAFDRIPAVELDTVRDTAARSRRRRRRLGIASGFVVAVAAAAIALVLVVPAKNTTVTIAPADGGGIPAGAACPRLTQLSVTGSSSGRLKVPGFDAALLCQYLQAFTGHLELSALANSTPISGTEAARFRDALNSAPAWPGDVHCATPSPQKPMVQALLYRDFKPVGSVVISLTGCHMIQGAHGQANADGAFQTQLHDLISTDGATRAGPLAGIWHVHTYYLSIYTDGHGVFTWPIHTTCGTGPGQGPPPCDALRNGSETVDGGYATLTITQRAGDSATGLIASSTDPSTLPNGSVSLHLAPNDLLYLETATPAAVHAYDYLCGQEAASLPTADQVAQQINCGA